MNKRYYSPDSNEFHLGFNYEINEGKLLFPKWIKYSFDIYDVDIIHTDNEYEIRVKYLDSDDIKNCGFELIRKGKDNNIRKWLFKKRLDDDYD